MSVKRYSVNLSVNRRVEVTESLYGSLVKYHDYAALEARCAALAAENAGLKAAIETHKHGFVRCNCCGDELMCHTDDVCRALDETQATESFLAEVRAQGVEMFADSLLCPDLDDTIREFADELRKGVQS